jgi:mannose-6-phosphate isomerase-like protein (cupin superfamily)
MRKTTIATLGASLLAMSLSSPVPAQQGGHPHQALTSEQKRQLAFPMLGGKMFIEVDSDKTNGTVAVVRVFAQPKYGPPQLPRVNTREDAVLVIVRGHYRFRLGSEEIDAPVGTILFMPRDVPHLLQNIGDEPGEHLLVLVPGGLEKMFREISTAEIELPRDLAKLQEIAAKYGVKGVPPRSITLSDPK